MTEKILLLFSYNDFISKNRYRILKGHKFLQNTTFEQCFALAYEKEKVDVKILFERIAKAINEYKPSIFLMHTGVAYKRNTGTFIETLKKLKKVFPELKFGYEHRDGIDEILESINVFEDSIEVKNYEELFFKTVLGR